MLTQNALLACLMVICPFSSIFSWNFFGSGPSIPTPLQITRYTLMLDPSGDAKDAGREVDDAFERGITMQCAEELKKSLEAKLPAVRVILTRYPGETVEPLQNAAFANRLKVDLYISLHFYETKDKIPKIHLYYVLYNPDTDFWGKKLTELALLPFDQAYKLSLQKTDTIIKSIYNDLKKNERMYGVACTEPQGFPFKPLTGIIAPSLAFEIGLKKKDDWKKVVPLLVDALEPLMTEVSHGASI